MLDVRQNAEKALSMMEACAERGTDLIVFPELFTTGYDPRIVGSRYYDLAEPIDGPTLGAFKEQARRLGVNVIVPMACADKSYGRIYNSAVAIDRNGYVLGCYHKVHLWSHERNYFTPGHQFPVFHFDFGKVGIMICYDGGFPEVARALARNGAELIVCPSAFAASDIHMWDIYFLARALENTCYVAGINRVGVEGDLEFFGKNKVVDPDGRVMLEGTVGKEEVQRVGIDLERIKDLRKKNPFLRDLRPEVYASSMQSQGCQLQGMQGGTMS